MKLVHVKVQRTFTFHLTESEWSKLALIIRCSKEHEVKTDHFQLETLFIDLRDSLPQTPEIQQSKLFLNKILCQIEYPQDNPNIILLRR